MGRSSFQEACEVIYVTTFQREYFKNNSKRGLLKSWDEAPFKGLVNSCQLLHFSGNNLKTKSKWGLLNSWEEAPFKRLVKSYKLLPFKGNILKITPAGAC